MAPLPLELALQQLSSVLQVVPDPEVSEPMHGQSHTVHRLKYPDGQTWGIRLAKDDFAAQLSRRGAHMINHLKSAQPLLQIPSVIYEDEKFAVFEYLEGSPVGCWSTIALNKQRRCDILDGLAHFLCRLWSTSAPDSVPDSAISYRDWLVAEIDKAICRSLHDSTWGNIVDFLRRLAKMDELVPASYDRRTISHGDLNAWNVLADDRGLSGVIDWDTAQFLPLPAAVQHPIFIANIPGWRNDGVPEEMDFEYDRAYLESTVRKVAAEYGLDSSVPDLLATSRERQFFQLSLRNKLVNQQYAQLRLKSVAVGRKQLADFLRRNPSLANNPAILELQARYNKV